MKRQTADKVWYIGTDDTDLDLFEGQYPVPEGISYNSYLITDEKAAILDTSDARKADEWKDNLLSALGGREPDYLVVHHLEPDHSALIAWVMDTWPSLTVVAGRKAVQMLPQFFEGMAPQGRIMTMKDGDTLELGEHRLRFIDAPMVHWPEVMVTFDEADGTLYSADAFGKFGALSRCGFSVSEDAGWDDEARRYYINIVGKYGAPVQTLLKKTAGLPIKAILPLHGPIIDSGLGHCIELYDRWSRYEPESEGVFIACASIHGGTMAAAQEMAGILRSRGVKDVKVADLCRRDVSYNVADAFRYRTVILAAASYDGGVFSPMCDFLHRLRTKGWANHRTGIIENGSWAPSAARTMKEMLSCMKNIEVAGPVVTVRSRMKSSDIPALESLADSLCR